MKTIDVLDHGHVALVEHMGGDNSIVRSALASYGELWRDGGYSGSDARIIRHLLDIEQILPLESVNLTFHVKAPIFLIRQWDLSRYFSYRENSAYLNDDMQFYCAEYVTDQRARDDPIKAEDPHPESKKIIRIIKESNANAIEVYRALMKLGCQKTIARTVLPVATYMQRFTTVNLHTLFNFVKNLMVKDAPKELKDYAKAALKLAEDVAPIACEAFKDMQKLL